MHYFNEIEHGVCPDCENPHGYNTCSDCGAEAEGVYHDDGFTCYACCLREAEQSYDYRWERAPEPEEWDLPF